MRFPCGAGLSANITTPYWAPAMPVFAGKPAPTGIVNAYPSNLLPHALTFKAVE